MSFISYELDAMNKVPAIASATGTTPAAIGWGLPQMWLHCFRGGVTTISDRHLRAFFGPANDLGETLEAFGFLEAVDDGWRVRGADRYLRIKEAQREGGRKGRARSSSPIGKKDGAGSTSRYTSRSTLPGDATGSTLKSTTGSTLDVAGPAASENSAPNVPRSTLKSTSRSTSRSAQGLDPVETTRSEQALTPITEKSTPKGVLSSLNEHPVGAPPEPAPGGAVSGAEGPGNGSGSYDVVPVADSRLMANATPEGYPGMDPDEDPRALPDWCVAKLVEQAAAGKDYESPTYGPSPPKFADAALRSRCSARLIAEARLHKAERERRLN